MDAKGIQRDWGIRLASPGAEQDMRGRAVVRLAVVMVPAGSRSRINGTGNRQQAQRGIDRHQPQHQDLRQRCVAQGPIG